MLSYAFEQTAESLGIGGRPTVIVANVAMGEAGPGCEGFVGRLNLLCHGDRDGGIVPFRGDGAGDGNGDYAGFAHPSRLRLGLESAFPLPVERAVVRMVIIDLGKRQKRDGVGYTGLVMQMRFGESIERTRAEHGDSST